MPGPSKHVAEKIASWSKRDTPSICESGKEAGEEKRLMQGSILLSVGAAAWDTNKR